MTKPRPRDEPGPPEAVLRRSKGRGPGSHLMPVVAMPRTSQR